jgi:hypothetical protein
MDGTRRDMRVVQYCDELINYICLLVMIYYLVEKDLLNTHDMKQRSRVELTGPLPNSDGMPLNFIFL